jgi:endonuclease YncB( thermonuclease family)
VVDGDTVEVTGRGGRIRIRLYGVDCPERGQPFYAEARQFVTAAALNHVVVLRRYGRDRNGREIARLRLHNGQDLSLAIAEAGWGWWFERYAPTDSGLQAAELRARLAGRGIWASEVATAPWEFRRRRSSNAD